MPGCTSGGRSSGLLGLGKASCTSTEPHPEGTKTHWECWAVVGFGVSGLGFVLSDA